jgi:pimeloyl-ACP methyl ester carboxylesterase
MPLTVVLLHAFHLSSAMWRAQHEGLGTAAGVDIDLITPDLPGFGAAPPRDEQPDLGVLAESVLALLDERGLRQVVLGGLSMGGYVAMEILRRRPSVVSALVLADTKASADTPEARDRRLQTAGRLEQDGSPRVLLDMLPAILGETTRRLQPDLVDGVRAETERADPAAAAWAQRAMAARPSYFETLESADMSALVVVGAEDTTTPLADARAMADALPQGRLELIDHSGHLSAMEAPKAFNQAVGDFLRSLRRHGEGVQR